MILFPKSVKVENLLRICIYLILTLENVYFHVNGVFLAATIRKFLNLEDFENFLMGE